MPEVQWARVQMGACIVLAVSFLIIIAVNEVISPPLLIFAVLFVAIAFALYRWESRWRWIFLAGAALSLAAILGNLEGISEDLAHPETFFGFVPTAVGVLAGLVIAVAGALGPLRTAPDVARPLALAATALAVAALLGSAVAVLSMGDESSQAGDRLVLAKDAEYPELL